MGSVIFDKVLGDISRRSAYSQILIGVASGWATGFTTMKIGKIAAFVIGGSIILVEIAHQEGLIQVNWPKLMKKMDIITKQIQSPVVENHATLIKKTETYIDGKLDKADSFVQNSNKTFKKWYTKMIGDDNGPRITSLHIFLCGFIGGVALGIATS
ncbi:uncharacterized protein Dwil_GK18998, isoform A [Drosophila willistoni]|uniref:Uncharacterized protein, isoform A n=1 Tax=Drosophila willistoni TaxID=7260 RepID=B4NQC4_DROWI|nr:FUN14 domain-containing protein 1 [Drosophila willistoni]EDW86563.1 uncharacterized protein Dwil_GK18998, isoform A [Drosophila willistoni]